MKTKINTGKNGENIAAKFLEKQGIKILERNWRFSRVGEIDIIAKDGDTLVFIEVKTRSSADFGHPLEAISPNKFSTINKLAEIYIAQDQIVSYKDLRIDLIGILNGKSPEVVHVKGIYQ